MVIVDLVSNILDFFLSPTPHSLSFSLSPLSRSISIPLLVSVALRSFSSISDPFLQSDILASQNDVTGATSFAYNAKKLRSSSRSLKNSQPLCRSNILYHRPHPLHRLPPWHWRNRRARHLHRRPHGLLHPWFPQLQTRCVLWWFWWFLGFWWFLFFVWSVDEGRVWWWCLVRVIFSTYWHILWQNSLYLGRSKLGLMYQEVCEIYFTSGIIKVLKIEPRNKWRKVNSVKLDTSSTLLSIET